MTDTPAAIRAKWLEREKQLKINEGEFAPVPPARLLERAGIDAIRAVMAGELPRPPICKTLDFFLAEVELGHVVFQGNPRFEHFNPIGSIHGGWTATLLDSAVACAIHTTLPPGKAYTTLELKVNYVRAILPDCGPLRAEGKVINVGGRVGTAEGRLTDAEGRLYAHATTTCLIFDPPTR